MSTPTENTSKAPVQRKKLGELLIQANLIDQKTLENALEIQKTQKKKIGQILMDMGDIDDEMIAESIQRNSSFNIIHRESMFKVDVFIPRPRPFQQSQLARAQRQTFAFETEMSANFASAEDTILSKLEWYRLGGEVSERQWRDILGVLKTRAGELDLDYLRTWAIELKVSDLLERSFKEAA